MLEGVGAKLDIFASSEGTDSEWKSNGTEAHLPKL